jgi:NADH dehydrogenase
VNVPAERHDRPRNEEITETGLDLVTGAFSYSGSAIAKELIASGRRVRTVTGHPERAPHLPVFAVGGRGEYRVRGIHVDDLARLCVEKGAERGDSVTDAVGPERPTFLELVTTIRDLVGSRARIVRIPGATVPLLARLLGIALRDVLLTRDEYRAMAAGLADTDGPATGPTALSDWLAAHVGLLGIRYANELHRHFSH